MKTFTESGDRNVIKCKILTMVTDRTPPKVFQHEKETNKTGIKNKQQSTEREEEDSFNADYETSYEKSILQSFDVGLKLYNRPTVTDCENIKTKTILYSAVQKVTHRNYVEPFNFN